jgi:hypothetical protein
MGDWKRCLTTQLRGETILFLVMLLALSAGGKASAQGGPHRAGLVIRFGDGSVITRCVSFGEASLTGMQVLIRAGLSIRVDTSSSIGAGVCKINSQGCDAGKSCFCQCEGSTCAYWQYFHLQNGAWKYSNLGASVYQVSDGAVEGWAWGNNVAPPVMTLDQVCASASSAPAPTNVQVTRAPMGALTPTPPAPAATPTLAVTVLPVTASAMPAFTPTLVPATEPAPAASPAASPTTAPADLALSPTVSPTPQSIGGPSPAASYALFGVLVLGLGAWLLIQSRRKAR